MSAKDWESLFDQTLESVSAYRPLRLSESLPAEVAAELRLAQELASLDLSPQSAVRESLRSRLALRTKPRPAPLYRPAAGKLALAAAAMLLLALLALVNQPVLAAVQRMLGYGYLPETGFIRLADNTLLQGPVVQEQGNASLSVRQGVSDSRRTRVWVRASDAGQSLAGAWLALDDGRKLAAVSWAWYPDKRDPTGALLVFPPLPPGSGQTVLGLPGGWQVPLEWAPAAQVGLSPTEVILPTESQTPPGQSLSAPCATPGSLLRICVQAAYVDAGGTHLLLEVEALQPGARFAGEAAPASFRAQLVDEQQRVYASSAPPAAGDKAGDWSLQFAPLAGDARTLTLRLSDLPVSTADSRDPAQAPALETLPGPFSLAFQLPERQPTFAPTPRVVDGSGSPLPAPTPAAPEKP